MRARPRLQPWFGDNAGVLAHAWQIAQRHIHVLECLHEEYPGNDDEEATHIADDVLGSEPAPLLKEDRRREDDKRREDDIQYWRDDRRVVDVERPVEVDHLDGDAEDDRHEDEPRQRVRQFVVASESLLEGDAETLAAHHRQRANRAGDRHVDEWICLSVTRTQIEDEDT